jgi:hypothetical protein
MADSAWRTMLVKMRDPERSGSISPLSMTYQLRRETILRLAKTPGLAAVHILDSTPIGYNGPRVKYFSFPGSRLPKRIQLTPTSFLAPWPAPTRHVHRSLASCSIFLTWTPGLPTSGCNSA